MENRYNHILVPLDGSELAESALPDACTVARLSQAQITLLHVVPAIDHVIGADTDHPIYVDQQWESKRTLALEYLYSVRRRIGCDGITVNLMVEMGSAAETIIDYAHCQPIDLIVMATHGRSGLQRWVYGSVADKVLRGANLPVLLVRAVPDQGVSESNRLERAVV